MDEQRLMDIEVKLAHQEHALEQVSEVLADQQSRLSRLEQVYRTLAERLRSMSQAMPSETGEPDKPPHY